MNQNEPVPLVGTFFQKAYDFLVGIIDVPNQTKLIQEFKSDLQAVSAILGLMIDYSALKLESVDLSTIKENLQEEYKQQKNLQLAIEKGSVNTDKGRVMSILRNLIHNALEARMQHKLPGTVEVKLEIKTGGNLEISVTNPVPEGSTVASLFTSGGSALKQHRLKGPNAPKGLGLISLSSNVDALWETGDAYKTHVERKVLEGNQLVTKLTIPSLSL